MITTFESRCVLKFYVIVLRPIFDATYKREIQVQIYMWDLHHKLVLFQQSRNIFCYVPENEIEGDILGWNPSPTGYEWQWNETDDMNNNIQVQREENWEDLIMHF